MQRRATRAHGLDAGSRGFIANRQHSVAVLQAVLQRFGAKQNRQRYGHCAHLQHRHVGDRRFKALRQDDGDAVTPFHAEFSEQIGKFVGGLVELAVAVSG